MTNNEITTETLKDHLARINGCEKFGDEEREYVEDTFNVLLRLVNPARLENEISKLNPYGTSLNGCIISGIFDFKNKYRIENIKHQIESTVEHTGSILNDEYLKMLNARSFETAYDYAINYLYLLCHQRGYFKPRKRIINLTQDQLDLIIKNAYDDTFSLVNDGSHEGYLYLKYIEDEPYKFRLAYGGEGYCVVYLKKHDRQHNFPERLLTNERNKRFERESEGKNVLTRLIFKGTKEEVEAAEYFLLNLLFNDPSVDLTNCMHYRRDQYGLAIDNPVQICPLFMKIAFGE